MKSSKILSIQTNADTQDNDVSSSNEHENVSKYEVLDNAPFVLVEGADGWFIVMGEHIVSEKRFKSKNDAKLYIDSKPYELIYVGAIAYSKILDKIQNDSNNFNNLNNEQES